MDSLDEEKNSQVLESVTIPSLPNKPLSRSVNIDPSERGNNFVYYWPSLIRREPNVDVDDNGEEISHVRESVLLSNTSNNDDDDDDDDDIIRYRKSLFVQFYEQSAMYRYRIKTYRGKRKEEEYEEMGDHDQNYHTRGSC
ncbi:hypothetical protein SOVF_181280 [Spinacia oleracea]|uniref:Uncharacterized protein n=1 Tax=Spinacia oleracea TaxID=3562 RepID=A0A9R0IY49_SPIOL|nr:uncharacterized protein LOC110796724 [Spinacia oleracea]KNA06413.1 hypothetical protein SOVF_181280 [Spinacia oleracea]